MVKRHVAGGTAFGVTARPALFDVVLARARQPGLNGSSVTHSSSTTSRSKTLVAPNTFGARGRVFLDEVAGPELQNCLVAPSIDHIAEPNSALFRFSPNILGRG